MRKISVLLLLLFACLSFSACAEDPGPLAEISRPYTGVYECRTLTIGGREMAEEFDAGIELEQDGRFTLHYRTPEGAEGGYGGTYECDTVGRTIRFTARQGVRERSYSFPMEKGTIFIDYNLFGKLLHAEFSMP